MQSYGHTCSQISVLQRDMLGVGLLEHLRTWGRWPNLTTASRSLRGRELQTPVPSNHGFQLLPPNGVSFSKWQNRVALRGGGELTSSAENGFPPETESFVVGGRVASKMPTSCSSEAVIMPPYVVKGILQMGVNEGS